MSLIQNKSQENQPGRFAGSSGRMLISLSLLAPVLLGLLLSWHSLSDFDIWLHHRVGQDILAEGSIPQSNTFSFVATDQSWLNHEWLFQLLATASHKTSDNPPNPAFWSILRTFLVGVLLVILVLGDFQRNRNSNIQEKPWLAWIGLPLLLGLHMMWPRLILRPELFSSMAFVILIRQLEGMGRGSGSIKEATRPLAVVFVVTLLWAQLHGFAALAPGIILLAMVAFLANPLFGKASNGKRNLRTFAFALALSLVALVLTPNGWAGFVYPLKALGQFQGQGPEMNRTISELVPLLETQAALGHTLVWFKISLVWAGLWIVLNWGKLNGLRILVWAVAAVAAFSMQRALGLYAVAFILLHTECLSYCGGLRWSFRFKIPQGKAVAISGTALTVILTVLWSGQILNDKFYLSEGVSRRVGSGLTPALYPVKIAQSLESRGIKRVLANVDAAGYLLANTPVQLFIDGRTEAYPPLYWVQYNDLKVASEKSFRIIKNLAPEAIVLSIGSGAFLELAQALVQGSSWQLISLDESALMFIPGQPDFKQGDNSTWLLSEIGALEALIGLKPTNSTRTADRYLAVARLWKMAGDPNAALRCYERGLEASPNHPTLNHNQGNLLMAHKNFLSALGHFESALAGNGRLASSALNAGVCLMNLKRIPEAEQMFVRCVKINDKSFEGWANLGISRIQQGKKKEAKSALEQALALRPGEQNLRTMLQSLQN